MTIEEARAFVGTTPKSGAAQLVLLLDEGLWSSHRVLEYGAGTLHLGKLLVAHQWVAHYYAVEPNRWLVDAAFDDDPQLKAMVAEKRARIVEAGNFDASSFNVKFEFVFAHSVLSHAARWQLPQFLARAQEVLTPHGKIIASARLGADSFSDTWVYPEVTYFSRDTIRSHADDLGLRVRFVDEHKQVYSAICPDEIHDWLVFEHTR